MAARLLDRALVRAIPLAPRSIVRPLAGRYIAGSTLGDALDVIGALEAGGRSATVDVLGEQLTTRAQIDALVAEYMTALDAFARDRLDASLSVKLTALGLDLDPALCAENLRGLVAAAADRSLTIELDMEDSSTTTATLDLYRSLRAAGLDNLVIALQAYLRRTREDVRSLLPMKPQVRLVKGIWVEPAAIAYTDYDTIRGNYVRLLDDLLAARCRVAIASHDEWIHWQAVDLIDRHGLTADAYEFQMLLGVREHLADVLLDAGHHVRIYVPYGENWYAYSVRRFKENPQLARHIAADVLARARTRGRR